MVNEASHFSDLSEILNFSPYKVEVIRFDTRAINSFNIAQTRTLMRPTQVCPLRSNSGHDAIMRQIELITSWKYFLYAMFEDSRSNEELTWRGGIRDNTESSWLQHWGTVQNLLPGGSENVYIEIRFCSEAPLVVVWSVSLIVVSESMTSGSVCLNSMSMFPRRGQ